MCCRGQSYLDLEDENELDGGEQNYTDFMTKYRAAMSKREGNRHCLDCCRVWSFFVCAAIGLGCMVAAWTMPSSGTASLITTSAQTARPFSHGWIIPAMPPMPRLSVVDSLLCLWLTCCSSTAQEQTHALSRRAQAGGAQQSTDLLTWCRLSSGTRSRRTLRR